MIAFAVCIFFLAQDHFEYDGLRDTYFDQYKIPFYMQNMHAKDI